MNYNFYIYTKKPGSRLALIGLLWAIRTEKKIKRLRDDVDILKKEIARLKEDSGSIF